MRSIAIINQKGGSGKTTTAVNLAAALGENDRRVLVVDMDPQASATQWFGIRNPGRGITDLIITQLRLLDLVRATEVAGVAIVPASAWLSGAEKTMEWDGASLTMFQRSVQALPRGQWDYMLVDCPPSLGILTANALIGVTEVLIPVEAHHMALPGVDRVMASVETLKKPLNEKLEVTGVLACRVDHRTRHSREVVQELRSRYGNLVFTTEVHENMRLAEAPAAGLPINLYDRLSKGARDYRDLANEIIGQES